MIASISSARDGQSADFDDLPSKGRNPASTAERGRRTLRLDA
jgi:hypothetical protein